MKIKAKVPNRVRSRTTGGGGRYNYRKGTLRAYGTRSQVLQALEEGFRPFYTYLEEENWVVTPCFVPVDIQVDGQEVSGVFFPCWHTTQKRVFPEGIEKLPGYSSWREANFTQGLFWEPKPIENRLPI
jgi:hypothetical protein